MKREKKLACVYCGSTENITMDHVVPLSRANEFGIHRKILMNHSNIVPACYQCNHEKGNMTPREWFDLHPEFESRFRKEARFISDTIKLIIEGEKPKRLRVRKKKKTYERQSNEGKRSKRKRKKKKRSGKKTAGKELFKVQPQFVTCDICGMIIAGTGYKRHMRKYHSVQHRESF